MRRLRFGVVGCGAISTLHQLPALRQCGRADLVAVVDTDRAWAATVARRFRVPAACDDYRELIGRVDAVLVATPNNTHADISCALLEQGIHVLCEKPMAASTIDVDRMLMAAARGGARLMAAHCLRFSPNLALLKRAVSAGWLGRLRSISAVTVKSSFMMGAGPFSRASSIWNPYTAAPQRTDFRRQRQLSGGGVLIDLGIHLIDLTVWLAGEAPLRTSYDDRSALGWEVETDAEVGLEFPSGLAATIACSFSHAMENALTVRGEAGWARAPLYTPTQLTLFSEEARVCRHGGVQELQVGDASMYAQQLEHFCHAVLTGAGFVVHADEVRASIGVVEECYGREWAAA